VLQQIDPRNKWLFSRLFSEVMDTVESLKKLKHIEKKYYDFPSFSRTIDRYSTQSRIFPSRYLQKHKIDKKGVKHSDAFTVGWSIDPRVSKHSTYMKTLVEVLARSDNFKRDSTYKGKVYNLRIENRSLLCSKYLCCI